MSGALCPYMPAPFCMEAAHFFMVRNNRGSMEEFSFQIASF